MHKERILVVDDEKLTLRLVKKILGKEGYNVVTAKNGEDALEILEDEKFDLLLTDIRMPGIDGMKLLNLFKRKDPDAAAVIFSGHGTIDMAVEAMGVGGNGFIIKPFTPDELIATVSMALEKVRLLRENIRLKSMLPLFEVSKRLVEKVNTDELLSYLVEVAKREAACDTVSIMLKTKSDLLEVRAAEGLKNGFKGAAIKIGEGLAGRVAQTGEPLVLIDNKENETYHNELLNRENIGSAIVLPIRIREEIKGVINVTKLKGNLPHFNEADADLMSILAGQAAVALENAQLVEGLNDLFMSTVRTLAKAVDMKSAWTGGHSERVTLHALQIGEQLGLSKENMKNLELAGLLHDIGKIGTNESILDKPDRLSKEEFDMVKKHSSDGCDLLEPIKQLNGISSVVRYHHERYDGKGYPEGLKGAKIPLLARILAVADTYDAMMSDRPYKSGSSIGFIIEEFKRCSGTQFDPEVVVAFLDVVNKTEVA